MIRISDEVAINFESNELIEFQEGHSAIKTKIEPRIMHVLQILIENSPNVVSREQLIEEVWDNYGGADNALNQAISHIRKMLKDNNKQDRIIETVVKKGYRFMGKNQVSAIGSQQLKIKANFSRFQFLAMLAILLTIIFVIYLLSMKKSYVPVAPEGGPNSELPAPKVDR